MVMKFRIMAGLMILALFAWAWSLLTPRDTHDQMIALLDQIKQRTADENPYLGDAELHRLEAELPLMPEGMQRVHVQATLGMHQLRLGKTEAAIDSFEAVYESLNSLPERALTEPVKSYKHKAIFSLAVAHLRRGEIENCRHCQTGESCILPIQGDGVHKRTSGSREAIKHLEVLLRSNPKDLAVRWLLNLAHMTLGNYPDEIASEHLIPPERFKSNRAFPRFQNIASAAGLDTFGLAGGVIIDDFDGDHFLDVVVSDWDPAAQLRFFRNNGDGSFSDFTEEAGFLGLLGGLNLKQADYDNDGDLDIFVLRGGWLGVNSGHPNSLLRNDGHARFRDITFNAGLGELHLPTQTGEWADFDNDGDLDLYVGNEKVPSQLFVNTGRGTFVDVATRAGVQNNGFTKGVAWGDYNGDTFPDLYVSNYGGANRLYRNNQDGTFTDVAPERGVTGPKTSFPVWFWDFNNDGVLDIYVSAYSLGIDKFVADFLDLPHEGETDHLYQGDGHGGFHNVAPQQNVDRVTLPMGSNFGDLNADGYLDYYLGTGYTDYEGLMPNLMFLNQAGNGFTDVTMAGGFGHLQKGHGVSFADLDNDGDQDVFIVLGGSNAGDPFTNALFENPGFSNHSIVIKLVGKQSNRCGIGARILAEIKENGRRRSVYKWVNSGGSFGANPLRQQIGLGKAKKIEVLEIQWPTTGRTQRFLNVAVDQFIEVTEGRTKFRKLPWTTFRLRQRNAGQDDSFGE